MPHHLRQYARRLDDRAVGRQVAEKNRQSATLAVGVLERANTRRVLAFRALHVLQQRLARHCHGPRVQHSRPLGQLPQDR